MASILKVDTLQKPDGSTPTAADLGIDVAGSVVQEKWVPLTSPFDTTVAGLLPVQSTQFTPKYANSVIQVEWSGHVYKYNTTSGGNSAAQITYNGNVIWSTAYLTYSIGGVEYMYAGICRGRTTAGTTSPVTIEFLVAAGSQGHQYLYGNTGGLLIKEIAQ
jgi:hypothetical protein